MRGLRVRTAGGTRGSAVLPFLLRQLPLLVEESGVRDACRMTLGGHHRFSKGLVEEVRERMARGVPFTAAPERGK